MMYPSCKLKLNLNNYATNKQTIKQYGKLLLFILTSCAYLVSCQKDDEILAKQIEKSNKSYEVISLEDAPNLIPIVDNVKAILPKNNSTNREGVEYIGLENVNVNEVIKITNETGKATYTFRIDDPNNTGINFENLHLVQTDNGYLAYILRYEPNEDWYYSTYTPNGELVFDMNTYQGHVTKFNLQREIIWTSVPNINNRAVVVECTVSQVPTCFNDGHGGIGDEHIAGANCNGPFGSTWVETCQTVTGGGGDGTGDSSGGGGGSTSTETPCIPGADGTNTQPLSGTLIGDDGAVAEETTSECVENVVVGVKPPVLNHEEELKKLSDHNKIKSGLNFLKGKLEESREYGLQFNLSGPTDYNYLHAELAPDGKGIKFPAAHALTVVEMHSHFNGLSAVFTPQDILQMAKQYSQSQSPNATAMLVAAIGSTKITLALRVKNGTKVANYFNTTNAMSEDAIEKIFDNKVVKKAREKCATSNCTNQEFQQLLINALVYYLEDQDTGLQLFQAVHDATENITHWEPVTNINNL